MTLGSARRLVLCVLLAATLAGWSGCSGQQATVGPRVADETRRLFSDRCALCHGIDGRGTPMSRGSADFTDPDWRAAARVEELIVVITQGRRKMLGFSQILTTEQIAALADGLKQGSGLLEER